MTEIFLAKSWQASEACPLLLGNEEWVISTDRCNTIQVFGMEGVINAKAATVGAASAA